MPVFAVGDRVRFAGDIEFMRIFAGTGTVVGVGVTVKGYFVEFDGRHEYHGYMGVRLVDGHNLVLSE